MKKMIYLFIGLSLIAQVRAMEQEFSNLELQESKKKLFSTFGPHDELFLEKAIALANELKEKEENNIEMDQAELNKLSRRFDTYIYSVRNEDIKNSIKDLKGDSVDRYPYIAPAYSFDVQRINWGTLPGDKYYSSVRQIEGGLVEEDIAPKHDPAKELERIQKERFEKIIKGKSEYKL